MKEGIPISRLLYIEALMPRAPSRTLTGRNSPLERVNAIHKGNGVTRYVARALQTRDFMYILTMSIFDCTKGLYTLDMAKCFQISARVVIRRRWPLTAFEEAKVGYRKIYHKG